MSDDESEKERIVAIKRKINFNRLAYDHFLSDDDEKENQTDIQEHYLPENISRQAFSELENQRSKTTSVFFFVFNFKIITKINF